MSLSLQETFDKMAAGLLAQGDRSWAMLIDAAGPVQMCAYRGAHGHKCAAGHLIADEHYQPSLEMLGANSLAVWQALVASGVPGTDEALRMILEVQHMHDRIHPSWWPTRLAAIAHTFGLADAVCK